MRFTNQSQQQLSQWRGFCSFTVRNLQCRHLQLQFNASKTELFSGSVLHLGDMSSNSSYYRSAGMLVDALLSSRPHVWSLSQTCWLSSLRRLLSVYRQLERDVTRLSARVVALGLLQGSHCSSNSTLALLQRVIYATRLCKRLWFHVQ